MRKVLLFILFTQLARGQTWQQTSDFPGVERDDAVSFVIGEKAFCGTGLKTGWVACNDFYVLDMINNSWDTIASMPLGTERQYACSFSSNNRGFVFGGINGATYYNDLWMYDPAMNNWQSKTALPASGRAGAGCFVINDTCYVAGGRT